MKPGVILALLAACALGILADRFVLHRETPAPAPAFPANQDEHARDDLSRLATGELEEYAKLRENRTRFEKADELLGKALLVLIADLGLRVSPELQHFAESAASRAPETVPIPERERPRETRPEPAAHTPTPQQFFPPFPAQPAPAPTPTSASSPRPPLSAAAAALNGPVTLNWANDAGKHDVNGNRLGWIKSGSNAYDYDAGFTDSIGTLRARIDNAHGYGTLNDVLDVGAAAGHRLHISAWIRTVALVDKGAFFIQANDRNGQRITYMSVTFDGLFDWKPVELTLDVPPQTWRTYFGLRLEGKGQEQIRDVVLDVTQ